MSVERARTADLPAFERFAERFARTLGPGDVVALSGDLGAGKTTFVAAAVRALQGSDAASSPTFTFWQRYAGPPPIEHVDLYRLEDAREALELGLEEAFDSASIVFIEWPDRLPELVPSAAFRLTIVGSGDEPRELTLRRE